MNDFCFFCVIPPHLLRSEVNWNFIANEDVVNFWDFNRLNALCRWSSSINRYSQWQANASLAIQQRNQMVWDMSPWEYTWVRNKEYAKEAFMNTFYFCFLLFFCYLAGKQQHDLSVCIEFGVCICLADWMTAMLADGTPHTVGWVSMKFCVCRRTQLRVIGIQQTERISFSCYLAVAVVVIILLLFLCVCVWCAYAM